MHVSLSALAVDVIVTVVGAVVYAATDRKPACLLGLASFTAGLIAILIGLH